MVEAHVELHTSAQVKAHVAQLFENSTTCYLATKIQMEGAQDRLWKAEANLQRLLREFYEAVTGKPML